MGMQVKGVGGVGIKVTEEMFVKMIDSDWFSDDLEPSKDLKVISDFVIY